MLLFNFEIAVFFRFQRWTENIHKHMLNKKMTIIIEFVTEIKLYSNQGILEALFEC